MDPEIEALHWAQAERHVAEGRARLARQAAFVAELAPDSHLRPLATKLLATLQDAQRVGERHLAIIITRLTDLT